VDGSRESPQSRGRVVADAVVVAAGQSSRMGGVDKVDALLGGRPLLAWSLDAIAAAPEVERIVVVLNAQRAAEASRARPAWFPAKVIAAVAGGRERQLSVAAGVRALDATARPANDRGDGTVVLVHDGARPLVSTALVSAVAQTAAAHGAALPILPIVDTVKRVEGTVDGGAGGAVIGATVDRAGLAAAQTPQGVRRELLARAYVAFPPDAGPAFTDEAALLEACAIPIASVPGEPRNLKVTRPADLAFVREIVAAGGTPRVGLGTDGHPFGPGEPLRLGGIEIAGAPRLFGHSDGDVALHAIADALLGAAALGDLGRLFPADRRTARGVASAELLSEVVTRLSGAGWRPASIDVTIVGARPRLGERLADMVQAIAELLGLDRSQVSVKASSGNLSGDEGAGRSISARAIASIVRSAPDDGTTPAAVAPPPVRS
jgi:2-C-methyl-D-erythritol 4-phosphate cytidylyltransferase / 2-C-methyl-D-erythritol 2,4-cyclodiphosphate synthase